MFKNRKQSGPNLRRGISGKHDTAGHRLELLSDMLERAAGVYDGIDPLTAADVAEAIAFVAGRPGGVDIDYVSIKPTAQATAKIAHRRG